MEVNSREARIRIGRMSIAFLIYVFAISLCGLSIKLGLIPTKTEYTDLIPESVVLALSSGLIFWAISSGFSQRFKDPSLALFQILISIAWITYAVYLIQIGRGIMLCTYMLAIFFGAFKLKTSEFILTTISAIFAFSCVVIWEHFNPPPNYNPGLNLFLLLTLSVYLSVFSFLAAYMRKLKDDLRNGKRALEVSHKEIQQQRDEIRKAYLEMQGTLKHLGEIASRDELTGLFNRRQFIEVYKGHLTVSKATNESFALALLDIDHFKRINDNYGHSVGDRVLKKFSEIAQDSLRDSDFIARYGGEEFVVILPSTNKQAAVECIERVRTAFSHFAFDAIQEGLRISVSTGISHFSYGESGEDLVERVDAALYHAKNVGRNRTIYFNPPSLQDNSPSTTSPHRRVNDAQKTKVEVQKLKRPSKLKSD